MEINALQGPASASRGLVLLLALTLAPGHACSFSTPHGSETRVVVDELDRLISVPVFPQRIVSLAPSITETIYALGIEDRLAGVTSFCDYPPAAEDREVVGDTLRPGIEKIIALRTDLVLASTASQLEQFVQKLEELDVPVYVTSPRNFEGVLASIRNIGELTGAKEAAEALNSSLRARLAAVEARVKSRPRKQVLILLGTEPLITAGGTSFINDLIELAGGVSISRDQQIEYPMYSLEAVLAGRPEIIFLQSGNEELPARLRSTPAALGRRVFRLDDALLLRPGPRVIGGIEEMARLIHPDAFEDSE